MKKKKTRLCLATIALVLILTSAIGGEISERYKNFNSSLVSPLGSRLLVQARTEDRGLDIKPDEPVVIKETTKELISFYSQKYAVSEQLVSCVIEKESSFDPLAIGDNGKAVGLGQFHLATWRTFRAKMGLDGKDERTDKAEAIKTLVWGLSQGLGSHWSPVKDGRCK